MSEPGLQTSAEVFRRQARRRLLFLVGLAVAFLAVSLFMLALGSDVESRIIGCLMGGMAVLLAALLPTVTRAQRDLLRSLVEVPERISAVRLEPAAFVHTASGVQPASGPDAKTIVKIWFADPNRFLQAQLARTQLEALLAALVPHLPDGTIQYGPYAVVRTGSPDR